MVHAAAEAVAGSRCWSAGPPRARPGPAGRHWHCCGTRPAVAAVASDRAVPPRGGAARAAGDRAANRGVAERGPVLPRLAEGGLGERVAAGLRELMRDPARAPVRCWPALSRELEHGLTARPAGGADPHAQARELLAGKTSPCPRRSPRRRWAGSHQTADARMVPAAAGGRGRRGDPVPGRGAGAAGRYRNAPPAAAALIHAAIDARRLGVGAALPQAFLEAAAPGYLTDAEWDAAGRGLAGAGPGLYRRPAKGVRGPLTAIRPRPASARPPPRTAREHSASNGTLYRLADYLDQHGRAHPPTRSPRRSLSDAAVPPRPSDLTAPRDAARDRGLYRYAAALWTTAVALGSADAADPAHRPTCAMVSPGDTTRAIRWAVDHVNLDDPWAVAVAAAGRCARPGPATWSVPADPRPHPPRRRRPPAGQSSSWWGRCARRRGHNAALPWPPGPQLRQRRRPGTVAVLLDDAA